MSEPTASDPDARVVICGGGISGLTLAYRLHQQRIPFVLFEQAEHWGGNIQTARHDGYLYDLGPDSFLRTKPEARDLCVELGLGDDLIAPKDDGVSVWVVKDRTLYPMPEGLTLGVPKRPWPILDTPLLSPIGKLRALLEPFVPPARGDDKEETIHQFLARRMGAEAAAQLAAPLLAGVFAGDAHTLSMQAAFPQLVDLEKSHGSLFTGMNGGKSVWQVLRERPTRASNPFLSLRGGLGQLVDTLVAALPAESLRLRTRVLGLAARDAGAWVRTSAGDYAASRVCFGGPPWAAAELLGALDPAFQASLLRIHGFSTATVFFGWDEAAVHQDLTASGFIVPPGEGEILAATFISSKWAHRAPQGKVLVRAFVGGARQDITSFSDSQLLHVALRELSTLLGDWGAPEWTRVFRYSKGTPQPELGHGERLAALHSTLARYPWLSVIGSGYGAVGIPDCVRQANAVAAEYARTALG